MAQTVMGGLLYTILELYLDDITVFDTTEDEYLKNLRQVFERLGKFGVTPNPTKCKSGLEEVEYVGHTINKDGMFFSDTKRKRCWTSQFQAHTKNLSSSWGYDH